MNIFLISLLSLIRPHKLTPLAIGQASQEQYLQAPATHFLPAKREFHLHLNRHAPKKDILSSFQKLSHNHSPPPLTIAQMQALSF